MKTATDFQIAVGRTPQKDDLERCNCPHAGEPGHYQCGWCENTNRPRFLCACEVCIPPHPPHA